jgi:hypothetical protein
MGNSAFSHLRSVNWDFTGNPTDISRYEVAKSSTNKSCVAKLARVSGRFSLSVVFVFVFVLLSCGCCPSELG